jgi:lipopolysaccharide transport system ATP-binding protein
MGNTVIKVENLSKQYRLGLVGASTFKEDTSRWWAKMRGKEDPFLSLGLENDRTSVSESKFVWSLRDINFEVQQGDVLGIIGRNGAGKSTLLKILSKITSPTTGTVKAKGRIASLLEVGTGFHPELTGRENIFLNGAILGMRKHEIKSKLDEIIAFSGVERYIDTPVKRYSSGMYVRLAFAVAAHLENEILIIDEVLAVGDAEFQKKCLGKMGDVSSNEGRTVLFVSHNMSAVNQLCNNILYLKNGLLFEKGTTNSIVNNYLIGDSKNFNSNDSIKDTLIRRGNGDVRFENISINDGVDIIDALSEIKLDFTLKTFKEVHGLFFSVIIFTREGNESITDSGLIFLETFLEKNQSYSFSLKLEKGIIRTGLYPLYLWIGNKSDGFGENVPYDVVDKLFYLNIQSNLDLDTLGYDYSESHGYFNIKTKLSKC